MKKTKNEMDEQTKTAAEKIHALVGELLDADVRPEVISTAMSRELACAVASIASLKEDKTPEERETFVKGFFEMLANLSLDCVKKLEFLGTIM